MLTESIAQGAHACREYVRKISCILKSDPIPGGGFPHGLQERDIRGSVNVVARRRSESRRRGT